MKRAFSLFAAIAALAVGCSASEPETGGKATVAVAANFTAAAEDIAEAFEAKTGDDIVLSFGSTGKLYSQIEQGAPFDVFLAADQERPARCIAEGHCVADGAFTYATGKLALWNRDPDAPADETALSTPFDRLAIANPATAPYGAAAMETLASLGLADALKVRIVQGDSIAQTHQYVASGAADLGFVALSQVKQGEDNYWLVPQALYTPLRQDAALTVAGDNNPAAKAFLDFLKGPEAQQIIEQFGYGVGDQ